MFRSFLLDSCWSSQHGDYVASVNHFIQIICVLGKFQVELSRCHGLYPAWGGTCSSGRASSQNPCALFGFASLRRGKSTRRRVSATPQPRFECVCAELQFGVENGRRAAVSRCANGG